MKKQFVLGLAFLALSLSACEDDVIPPKPSSSSPASILSIHSFYPEMAVSGSDLMISGENFGASIFDNNVTFNSAYSNALSEVKHVEPGRIVTRVPEYLVPGEYTISISANGQVCTKKCLIVDLK